MNGSSRRSCRTDVVDRQMPLALIMPGILLIDRHAHQVGHHLREAMVVVSFYPDDLRPMRGFESFRMNPRNFQCSLVSLRKLRSLKMSPSKIRRLNLIDCKRCKASLARLTSEPKCTSEMIRVSIRSFPMHYFCSNSRLRNDESHVKSRLNPKRGKCPCVLASLNRTIAQTS